MENLRRFQKISGDLKKYPEIYRKSPEISIYPFYEVFVHIVVRDNPKYRPRKISGDFPYISGDFLKSPDIFHKSPEICLNLRRFFEISGVVL